MRSFTQVVGIYSLCPYFLSHGLIEHYRLTRVQCSRRQALFMMLLRNFLGSLPITSASPSVVEGVVGGVVESVVGEPTVRLDYGTFKGNAQHLGVDSFLGMPFAKAGRLENPRLVNSKLDRLEGTQDATKYGDACPQSQFTGLSSNTRVSLVLRRQSSKPVLTVA